MSSHPTSNEVGNALRDGVGAEDWWAIPLGVRYRLVKTARTIIIDSLEGALMSENRLPNCFGCGGPVHGGPCSSMTQDASACQACLYRAARPNGLCDDCDARERHDYYLTMGGPTMLRYAANEIRNSYSLDGTHEFERAVADWLDVVAERWSHDATGTEMDAAEHVARCYLGGAPR